MAQEKDVLDLLEIYRENITALEKSVVGHTKVYLEGRKNYCRSVECNMGNLITDAMIFSRVLEDQGGNYWTDAAIALHQGGGKYVPQSQKKLDVKQLLFQVYVVQSNESPMALLHRVICLACCLLKTIFTSHELLERP